MKGGEDGPDPLFLLLLLRPCSVLSSILMAMAMAPPISSSSSSAAAASPFLYSTPCLPSSRTCSLWSHHTSHLLFSAHPHHQEEGKCQERRRNGVLPTWGSALKTRVSDMSKKGEDPELFFHA